MRFCTVDKKQYGNTKRVTPTDLTDMTSRIDRAFRSVRRASGDTYCTSYHAAGQDFITNFTAIGIKPPEQLEDDFLSLFVWVWSLKDPIKYAYEARGLRGALVEEVVNASTELSYVADIANRAKHGRLSSSRSGEYPELIDVGFTIPDFAVAKITVAGPDVTLEVKDPEQVEIHATIATKAGLRIDALEVLSEAMRCWESKLLSRIAT